jgi:hypothetical protein
MEVSESYFKPFWNVLQGGRVYLRWEETIDYLRDYLSTHGPFDGLLGFSQVWLLPSPAGRVLSGRLPRD